VVVASLVATATTSPIVGQLGDIFGRRNVLIVGNLLGLLGNLISALGKNINTLIGGSVFIGLGSSMHQIRWAAVGEIVPKKRRPLAIAIFEVSASPPGALVALIGKIRSLILYFVMLQELTQAFRLWICEEFVIEKSLLA
jgi:MFS family permease